MANGICQQRAKAEKANLKFIRLLRVVFFSQQRHVTKEIITTRSNRMKFRLGKNF